uniref:Palmitoyltransferase n=1 Tax=Bursaphelenchus xylophilus TaxID=6326 RepID=A0A1I7S068_BURXY
MVYDQSFIIIRDDEHRIPIPEKWRDYSVCFELDRDPICSMCKTYKPSNAHHCQMCDTCVFDMDHHCAWINNCVGAHNHRHFFQFLVFLFLGAIVLVINSTNTFYYGFYVGNDQAYCNNTQLSYLLWRDLLCSYGNLPIYFCIVGAFYLSFVTIIMVGSLVYWNFAMISFGTTLVKVLRNEGAPVWKIALCPLLAPHFKRNWRRFLGLRGRRSCCRRLLLPSGHKDYNQMEAESYS